MNVFGQRELRLHLWLLAVPSFLAAPGCGDERSSSRIGGGTTSVSAGGALPLGAGGVAGALVSNSGAGMAQLGGNAGTAPGPAQPGGAAGSGGSGGSGGAMMPVEPLPPQLAVGIRLTEIELNQGVAVPLALDGEPLGPEDRIVEGDVQVRLVKRRGGLLRAFWELDAGFVPRELEAVLVLRQADAIETTLRHRSRVEGAPDRSRIDGSFHFELEPASVQPGTRYSVALYEVDAIAPTSPVSPPRIPTQELADLGVPDIDMRLELVMLPVSTDGVMPNLSQENVEKLRKGYFDMYPISELVLRQREGVSIGSRDIDEVLETVIRTRDDDQPEDHVHYIGLAPASETGWSGVATRGARSAASPMSDDADWRTIGYAVHETGHTVDMAHTPGCDAQGTNDDWPYEGTNINGQGYGILHRQLFDPDEYQDYMNYCTPDYASPFTYMLSYRLIEEDARRRRQAGPQRPQNVLRGILSSSGRESWWVSRAVFEKPSRSQALPVHVTLHSGAQTLVTGYLEESADSRTSFVNAPLPVAPEQIQSVRVHAKGRWLEPAL